MDSPIRMTPETFLRSLSPRQGAKPSAGQAEQLLHLLQEHAETPLTSAWRLPIDANALFCSHLSACALYGLPHLFFFLIERGANPFHPEAQADFEKNFSFSCPMGIFLSLAPGLQDALARRRFFKLCLLAPRFAPNPFPLSFFERSFDLMSRALLSSQELLALQKEAFTSLAHILLAPERGETFLPQALALAKNQEHFAPSPSLLMAFLSHLEQTRISGALASGNKPQEDSFLRL